MLGHRKISFVQWHSPRATDSRRSRASGENQISRNDAARRLPSGAWVSQTLTSPLA